MGPRTGLSAGSSRTSDPSVPPNAQPSPMQGLSQPSIGKRARDAGGDLAGRAREFYFSLVVFSPFSMRLPRPAWRTVLSSSSFKSHRVEDTSNEQLRENTGRCGECRGSVCELRGRWKRSGHGCDPAGYPRRFLCRETTGSCDDRHRQRGRRSDVHGPVSGLFQSVRCRGSHLPPRRPG